MGTAPDDYGHLGHRYQVWVENKTSGSDGTAVVADRVQSIEPTLTSNLEKAFELGNVDPVGTATDPTEYRVVIEENLHNSEIELLLAGKSQAAIKYNLGDFLVNLDNYIYLLIRDNDDVVINELEYGGGALAELAWRFVQGGACTTTLTLNCKSGKLYQVGSVIHASWGGLDVPSPSPGIIKGKDARLFLETSGSGGRVYRLQSFTLRATFPIQVVRELGNRVVVGYVIDTPDANLDFDLLDADHQPADVLATLSSGAYDFSELLEVDAYIRLYDPDMAQADANAIRSWKMENLRVATATVKRAQVRGLATQRYSMPIGKADTAGSAGVICYVGDIM